MTDRARTRLQALVAEMSEYFQHPVVNRMYQSHANELLSRLSALLVQEAPQEEEKTDLSRVDNGIGSRSTGSTAPTNEVIRPVVDAAALDQAHGFRRERRYFQHINGFQDNARFVCVEGRTVFLILKDGTEDIYESCRPHEVFEKVERGIWREVSGPTQALDAVDPVLGVVAEVQRATKDSSSSPPPIVVPEAESGPQDALHRELLLWLDDREINDQFERIGEKFYAETGFLRPGKAEPIDMCGGEEHAQHRQKAWRDWCAQWRLSLIERLSAALLVPAAPRSAQHGRDCPKVPHVGGGYLHDADDDRPYEVDRVAYCGRCHCWLESPFIPAAPPENKDDDVSRLDGVPESEHGDPRANRNEPIC